MVYARPGVDVLGLEVANAEGGPRFLFNRRQPLVGPRDDLGHTGHGAAAVIHEYDVVRLRYWKFWKLQTRNIAVGDRVVVYGNVARQGGLRFDEKGGSGRVVDDDLAIVLGEELKDNTGVRQLDAKHLRDESSATDSIDGDDIGVGVARQPGHYKAIRRDHLRREEAHQIPTTERGGMWVESLADHNLAILSMSAWNWAYDTSTHSRP